MTRITKAVALTCSLMLSACGGSPAGPSETRPPATPTPAGPTATTQSMLSGLEDYISWQLRELQEMLPRNPHNATQIQAKIALLQRPTLPAEVRTDKLYVEGSIPSIGGAAIPVSVVFALEALRGEAAEGLREIEAVCPILEGFLTTPFPSASVRMWYGFKVGNSGGGGVLYMEDKGTYASRPGDKMPYDPIYPQVVY